MATDQQDQLLDFTTAVPSRSYLDYALPLSVLSIEKTTLPVFFTYSVQTYFPDSLLGRGRLGLNKFIMLPGLNNWQWMRLGFLHVDQVDSMCASDAGPSELIELVADCIAGGVYVELRLDEFWLPCRSRFYGKSHARHINLLIGTSSDRQRFCIAGYDDDYGVAYITAEELVHSFFSPGLDLQCPSTDGSRFKRIWIWRKLNETSADLGFDQAVFRQQLRDYRAGASSLGSRVIARDDDQAFPNDTGTWGLQTYESWQEYLQRVWDEELNIDLRATRTLYEHKQCQLDRLPLVFGRRSAAPSLVSLLEQVRNLAAECRLVAFQFNLQRSQGLLSRLTDRLAQLRENDERAIDALLSEI